MPGLPRKSTVKQFKKLMSKSGKSRTNKSSGATDPSRKRIATYEQFHKFLESKIEWYEDGEFIEDDSVNDESSNEYTSITADNIDIGKKVYYLKIPPTSILQNHPTEYPIECFGQISNIEYVEDEIFKVIIDTPNGSKFILPLEKLLTYGFLIKI